MKRKHIVILAIVLLLTLGMGAARAQDIYNLTRSVIAAGGGASSGGSFILQGGIGQPVANPATTGGNYSLSAGFWTGMELLYKLMLPLVTKN